MSDLNDPAPAEALDGPQSAKPSASSLHPADQTLQIVANSTDKRWTQDADLDGRIENQQAQNHGWIPTMQLAYTAVGVVLGDLGTSPIYTLSAVFSENPSEDEVLGAASIIVWAITLVVIIKYQLIALRLDDHGEGGTFALYSLIARYTGFTPGLKPGSPDMADQRLERYSSSVAGPAGRQGPSASFARSVRGFICRNRWAQLGLLLLVLLMTSMVVGDGVLTPAQTVLGAFGALSVRVPSIQQSTIAGISMGVLALLFLAQPLGTHRLGFLYAPVLLVWFLFSIIVGIKNISTFYPAIFKVFNPYYLYVFFRGRSNIAWQQTATCFLALTGAEASYADLGQFTRPSIMIAFIFVLYPSVIITYLGQAAWMIKNPDGYATSFFSSIPYGDGFFWTYFVIAVAAACVASQTMISAAFSVIKQSIALNCFPRCAVVHTSKKVVGQVWVPLVLVFLAIFTIAAVGIFQNSVALGLSYGVCVSTMMMGTDFLIAIAMIVVWELPVYVPVLFLLVFGFIDGVFWTANLTKIPKGGWFAVIVAAIVGIFSYIWFIGTAMKRQSAQRNQGEFSDVLLVDAESMDLVESDKGSTIARLPGVGCFYTEQTKDGTIPTALKVFVKRLGALPQTVILMTIRQVAVSSVLPEERLLVQELKDYPGIFRAIARYGYTDRVEQDGPFMQQLLEKVNPDYAGYPAQAPRMVYVTLDARLKPRAGSNFVKRFFIQGVYNVFSRLLVVKAWEGWSLPEDMRAELSALMEI